MCCNGMNKGENSHMKTCKSCGNECYDRLKFCDRCAYCFTDDYELPSIKHDEKVPIGVQNLDDTGRMYDENETETTKSHSVNKKYPIDITGKSVFYIANKLGNNIAIYYYGIFTVVVIQL